MGGLGIYLLIFACLLESVRTEITNTQEYSPLLVGPPAVNCQIQRLTFEIESKEPFHGRLFVKGHSNARGCAADFYGSWSNETRRARIDIDYHTCGMERIRSLSPKGVTYANTITVQFHPTFITDGDKSFRVRCFYAEQQTTVNSDFDVSMVPTRAVEHDMELPSCGYTIRANTPNGPIVRSTIVGDLVYHRWECTKNMQVYGMLVHSCLIENDGGSETMMIDALGCPVDPEIVPGLTYNDELNLAYTSTHVFKYPDDNIIKFRCQIRICMKLENGCNGLTPPSCESNRKIRRSVSNRAIVAGNVSTTRAGQGDQHILLFDENAVDEDADQTNAANANLDVVAGGMFVFDETELPTIGVGDEQSVQTSEQYHKQLGQEDTENTIHLSDPLHPMSRLLQQQSRIRLHSATSFNELIAATSTSPGPGSSSDQKRSALRRGTDTTTAALEADNVTLASDTIHSSQWELCANRIILISILMAFVLFFIGSISFVVYVMMERQEGDVERGLVIETHVHNGPITPARNQFDTSDTKLPLPNMAMFSSDEEQ